MRCSVVFDEKFGTRHYVFPGEPNYFDYVISADQEGERKDDEAEFAHEFQFVKQGQTVIILFQANQPLDLGVRQIVSRGYCANASLLNTDIEQTDPQHIPRGGNTDYMTNGLQYLSKTISMWIHL